MASSNSTDTKSADVRLRLEPKLKEEAGKILADSGLDLSVAIRIFLKQVVAYRGLPFDVRQPNAATISAMKQARALGSARFRSAPELLDGLEKGREGTSRKAAAKKRLHKAVSKGLERPAGQGHQSRRP